MAATDVTHGLHIHTPHENHAPTGHYTRALRPNDTPERYTRRRQTNVTPKALHPDVTNERCKRTLLRTVTPERYKNERSKRTIHPNATQRTYLELESEEELDKDRLRLRLRRRLRLARSLLFVCGGFQQQMGALSLIHI